MLAVGRRNLVHPSLARVHERHGTPTTAIVLLSVLTALASCLGDAVLVPISEVGSLAVAIGWLSACLAFLARTRNEPGLARLTAGVGALVSVAIVVMKVTPRVPGSFRELEWAAFGAWMALGALFWLARTTGFRRRVPTAGSDGRFRQ
jgi:amino acid transporter